jgi:hypothetical protein
MCTRHNPITKPREPPGMSEMIHKQRSNISVCLSVTAVGIKLYRCSARYSMSGKYLISPSMSVCLSRFATE